MSLAVETYTTEYKVRLTHKSTFVQVDFTHNSKCDRLGFKVETQTDKSEVYTSLKNTVYN